MGGLWGREKQAHTRPGQGRIPKHEMLGVFGAPHYHHTPVPPSPPSLCHHCEVQLQLGLLGGPSLPLEEGQELAGLRVLLQAHAGLPDGKALRLGGEAATGPGGKRGKLSGQRPVWPRLGTVKGRRDQRQKRPVQWWHKPSSGDAEG